MFFKPEHYEVVTHRWELRDKSGIPNTALSTKLHAGDVVAIKRGVIAPIDVGLMEWNGTMKQLLECDSTITTAWLITKGWTYCPTCDNSDCDCND